MRDGLEKENIRIAIADDHKLVRQAIKNALSLESSLCIIFDAEHGEDLMTKLAHNHIDILLLDIKMPKLNGLEALKLIYEKYPAVKVIILSAFMDDVYVAHCLNYGIYAYLTKSMGIEEMVLAITLAHKNETYLNNLMATRLYKNYLNSFHKNSNNLLPPFSSDEIKILNLLTEEKTTKEISRIMNVSQKTVELKRDKMREKANKKTVAGLLLYALKRGIVD
jgi:DNA-binding NarL/FixJ family response regulator